MSTNTDYTKKWSLSLLFLPIIPSKPRSAGVLFFLSSRSVPNTVIPDPDPGSTPRKIGTDEFPNVSLVFRKSARKVNKQQKSPA